MTRQAVTATEATSAITETRGEGGHIARERTCQVWLQAHGRMLAVVRSKAGGKQQLSSCGSVRQKNEAV